MIRPAAGWVLCFSIAVLMAVSAVRGQAPRVEAVVVDARTGLPLSGVNVVVLGTTHGAVSDEQGHFILAGPLALADTVEISHIGYMARRVTVDSLLLLRRIRLVPKPVQAEEVEIQAERELLISRDVPAAVTILPMKKAASRAVDLADVLRRDPSVAISETATGAKFVSIRGGNPDEVLIVYDGIRLNSSAANTFDLSQIALANLARLEVIKGSNTVVFGDGAFGGVLHIVPKKEFQQSISASQRLGTFRANDLSLSLNKSVGRFSGSYTLSRRQADRTVRTSGSGVFSNGSAGAATGESAQEETRQKLNSENIFQTLWLRYRVDRGEISARYIHISNDFNNRTTPARSRLGMNIFSSTLEGRIKWFGHLGATVVRRVADRRRTLPPLAGAESRENLGDSASILRVFKRDVFGEVRLYYSYERAWYGLNGSKERQMTDQPFVLRSTSNLRRSQEAVVFVIQHHLDLKHRGFRYLDWDLSARVDWMSDNRFLRTEAGSAFEVDRGHTPRHAFLTYKFGFNGTGEVRGARYRAYLTTGANVKFPTLEQLFQVDTRPVYLFRGGVLDPERNIGTEFGLHIEKSFPELATGLSIRQVRFDMALFRNSYLNKIAELLSPLTDTRTPFNTRLAWTTGAEVQVGAALLDGLADLSIGYQGVNISDPRVFQFKPENKATVNLSVKHRQFSLWGSLFYEGAQTALLLVKESVQSAELPSRWDMDLAVRQSFPWHRFKGFVGLSINNLRNGGQGDAVGLFLRSRRWYVTFGVEI